MKITAALFALAAAQHGIEHDHHLNGAGIQTNDEVINQNNIRPDSQIGSNRNQVTRHPTPAPTSESDAFDNIQASAPPTVASGNTDQIDEQDALDTMPTVMPTSFPTKDQSDTDGKGTTCCEGTFCRPVGWVGAGAGDQFCNVWKCNPNQSEFSEGTDANNNGHFSKQVRTCSVEEHNNYNFCSHTTCSFAANDYSGGKMVINVHSDHREETGGNHMCGYAKHSMANNDNGAAGIYAQEMGSHITADTKGAQSATRPSCDCVCFGARRQDADNFARVLNQARVMPGNQAGTDETTNNNHAYDTANNGNNLYSKHSNADVYAATGNNNAQSFSGSNKGDWSGSSTHTNDATKTEYLENGPGTDGAQYANDQYVAHFHGDTQTDSPYDNTHKQASLYSGN